ncbi:hypothetical protein [Draconibacterium orientale]|uniref:hypothetical protein n=1 Tax=Draconibacterium orientale TaxID=1168034 RepID=UPI002ABD3CF5|nr:hypothetical protein [Draconibacterium orientale]
MKKQILFLTVFVAAILVGMNSYGQTNAHYGASNVYLNYLDAGPNCITPRSLENCDDVDELHPVQGQPYTYIVNTTYASDDVRWFVVNNFDLIDDSQQLIDATHTILPRTDDDIDLGDGTGDYILSVADLTNTYNLDPVGGDPATYTGITSDGTAAHSITITWKYFSGLTSANEAILLVAVVTDASGCTDNIEVYRIIPEPAFTLDVATLTQSGDSIAGPDDAAYAECVSPIESAVYNPGTGDIDENLTPGDSLIVDYGENWVYFIVNGANYIDSWLPNFYIEYQAEDGTVITSYQSLEASWAYSTDAATNTGWTTINNWSDSTQATGYEGTPVVAFGVDGTGARNTSPSTVGAGTVPEAGGECIVVRVRVDWGTQYEHDDAIRTIAFEVDGRQYDGIGTGAADGYQSDIYGDKHYADCTVDHFGGSGHDYIEYDITPRPEVQNAITTAGVDTEEKTGDEN